MPDIGKSFSVRIFSYIRHFVLSRNKRREGAMICGVVTVIYVKNKNNLRKLKNHLIINYISIPRCQHKELQIKWQLIGG